MSKQQAACMTFDYSEKYLDDKFEYRMVTLPRKEYTEIVLGLIEEQR